MSVPARLLPVAPAVAERLSGRPLVVMLDVDGTLAPIAARPEDAQVPPETRRVIAQLAVREGVHVALVTGRAAADARRMVSVRSVWVIGNHGYEIIGPEGETMIDPQVASYQGAVAQATRRLAPQLAHVPGVIVEDKGLTMSVHYRLADPGVVTRVRTVVQETVRTLGLRLTEGKMVYEVRPPAHINKGTAVLLLARQLGAIGADEASGGSVIFVGDDTTDEDAFRALRARARRAVTVRVSVDERAETAAEFLVDDTVAVRAVLEWLVESRPHAARA